MGTSAARSSSNTQYFKRGDLIPGLQVGLLFFALEWMRREREQPPNLGLGFGDRNARRGGSDDSLTMPFSIFFHCRN